MTPEAAIAARKELTKQQGYVFNREERAVHLAGLGRHVSSTGAVFCVPMTWVGESRQERDVDAFWVRTLRAHLRDVVDEERVRAAEIARKYGVPSECVEEILGSVWCPGAEKITGVA